MDDIMQKYTQNLFILLLCTFLKFIQKRMTRRAVLTLQEACAEHPWGWDSPKSVIDLKG